MNGGSIRSVPGRDFKPPNINFSAVAGLIALVILLGAVIGSVFKVEPEQVGVVLTFGKYTRIADPGLNFKLPFPIQTVVEVAVQRQLKLEFGFRTTRASVRST